MTEPKGPPAGTSNITDGRPSVRHRGGRFRWNPNKNYLLCEGSSGLFRVTRLGSEMVDDDPGPARLGDFSGLFQAANRCATNKWAYVLARAWLRPHNISTAPAVEHFDSQN